MSPKSAQNEPVGVDFLLRALQFSAEKHRAQLRKGVDASPYINHPIEVATMLANIGGVRDCSILAAAVLHDTIEDTPTGILNFLKIPLKIRYSGDEPLRIQSNSEKGTL